MTQWHRRVSLVLLGMMALVATVLASGAVARAAGPANSAEEEAWISLFNGKDLQGWKPVLSMQTPTVPDDTVFQVVDGEVHVYKDVPEGAKVPYGYIASDDEYSWYHFSVEYKFGKKRFAPRTERPRDAGILYHSAASNVVWPRSIECQIQEGDVGDCFVVKGGQVDTTVDPAKLKKGEHFYLPPDKGGVPDVVGGPDIYRVVKGSTHENEGWNTVECIIHGAEEATHIVNGHVVFRATNLKQLGADGKTWSPLESGKVLLQGEFAEVFYRNARIQPIKGKPFRVPSAAKSAAVDR